MNWYSRKMALPEGWNQGLVADEDTGQTIALVYDHDNSNLIACAPELLEMLKRLWVAAENQLDRSATHDGLNNCDLLRDVRVLLYKVEEGE